MAQTSFTLVMLGIAAGVALLLGVVGIYGVIAYVALAADARDRDPHGARRRAPGRQRAVPAPRAGARGDGIGVGMAAAAAGRAGDVGAALRRERAGPADVRRRRARARRDGAARELPAPPRARRASIRPSRCGATCSAPAPPRRAAFGHTYRMPPLNVLEFEALARDRMERSAFEDHAGAACDERTLAANRDAFDRWVVRPRVLVDVSRIDTATTVLASPVSVPILLAPTAFNWLAYPEGERGRPGGRGSGGTMMVASTLSTCSLEEIAGAASGPLWFQLYVYKDRGLSRELVARAEAAGFRALVLTVDTPLLGRRERDVRNRFTLPEGILLANFAAVMTDRARWGSNSTFAAYVHDLFDASLTWEAVEWLRSITRLPVVIKGILTSEDTRQAPSRASTPSSYRITADGSSTAWPPRSMRCRRCRARRGSPRDPTWTAGSGVARTCSRRSRSARGRCCRARVSVGARGGWRERRRRRAHAARTTSCGSRWRSSGGRRSPRLIRRPSNARKRRALLGRHAGCAEAQASRYSVTPPATVPSVPSQEVVDVVGNDELLDLHALRVAAAGADPRSGGIRRCGRRRPESGGPGDVHVFTAEIGDDS